MCAYWSPCLASLVVSNHVSQASLNALKQHIICPLSRSTLCVLRHTFSTHALYKSSLAFISSSWNASVSARDERNWHPLRFFLGKCRTLHVHVARVFPRDMWELLKCPKDILFPRFSFQVFAQTFIGYIQQLLQPQATAMLNSNCWIFLASILRIEIQKY